MVAAYATGGFRPLEGDRVTKVALEREGHADAGFPSVKIKIGFGVAEDLQVIRAVRAAIGSDIRLMIDANHGLGVLEAIGLGRRVAEYGIDRFEEPVRPEQLDACRAVRAGQPIPVAGGETWHGRFAFRAPLETRAVDIVHRISAARAA